MQFSSVSISCRWVNSTYCIRDQHRVSANPYSRLPSQLPKCPQSICACSPGAVSKRTNARSWPSLRHGRTTFFTCVRQPSNSRASGSPRTNGWRCEHPAPNVPADRLAKDQTFQLFGLRSILPRRLPQVLPHRLAVDVQMPCDLAHAQSIMMQLLYLHKSLQSQHPDPPGSECRRSALNWGIFIRQFWGFLECH